MHEAVLCVEGKKNFNIENVASQIIVLSLLRKFHHVFIIY